MTASVPVTRLEALSLNAWPSLQTVVYDGWLLRFAEGYTRRANSVNPIYASSLPLDEKIAYCEALYAARGQMTVFKLTGAHQPADLEAALITRGYRDECYTAVQTRTLDSRVVAGDGSPTRVRIDAALTDEWIERFAALSALSAQQMSLFARIERQVIPQAGYATLRVDGQVAAMAMGVIERGWLGVYDVVTAQAERGKGYAHEVMMALLGWGAANGAHQAYLQVMLDNAPALRLYARCGFTEQYRYWYRQK